MLPVLSTYLGHTNINSTTHWTKWGFRFDQVEQGIDSLIHTHRMLAHKVPYIIVKAKHRTLLLRVVHG